MSRQQVDPLLPRLVDLFDREGLTAKFTSLFRREMRRYYRHHGRHFPWRETGEPYRILVSEFMLQQTQVVRVLEHYGPFLDRFPRFEALASSSLGQVLDSWRGLGYNRRARALLDTARIVVRDYGGVLPSEVDLLTGFPGIGQATAGAVAAFAFHAPVAFIETNIRRVYLHFCFPGQSGVTDRRIIPIVEETLDAGDPRSWYYALMDYGTMLGKECRGLGRQSAHYTRQAPFEGSDRQIRSRVLSTLLDAGPLPEKVLMGKVDSTASRFSKVLAALIDEGLVRRRGKIVTIP